MVAVAAFLAAAGREGDAWRFAAAAAAALGAMLTLKLAFGTFPAAGRWLDLESPSGHAASAALAYGGAAWLSSGRRRIGIAAGAAAAVAIGATRVVLGMHSPAEAALGAAIGLAGLCAACAGRVAGIPAHGPTAGPRIAALVCLLLIAIVLHGVRAPVEPVLVMIETAFRRSVQRVPAVRSPAMMRPGPGQFRDTTRSCCYDRRTDL